MPQMKRVVEAIVVAVITVIVERISDCLGPAVDAGDGNGRAAALVIDLFGESDAEFAGELLGKGEFFVEQRMRRWCVRS